MTDRVFLMARRLGLRLAGRHAGRVLGGEVSRYTSTTVDGLSVESQARDGQTIFGVTFGEAVGSVQKAGLYWPNTYRYEIAERPPRDPRISLGGRACSLAFIEGFDECVIECGDRAWLVDRIGVSTLRVSRTGSAESVEFGPSIGVRPHDASDELVVLATILVLVQIDAGFSVRPWINFLAGMRRPFQRGTGFSG